MASFYTKKASVITIQIVVMVAALVKGQEAADHSHFLSFNDDPPLMVTTQQPATAVPLLPIETPLTPEAEAPADQQLPIEAPLTPASIMNPPPTPTIVIPPPNTNIPIGFSAPIIPPPYDMPYPDIPIIGIPGLHLPRNRHCVPLCSRRCTYYRRRRFAYVKCFGGCAIKCMRGRGTPFNALDCTQNCVNSKSIDSTFDVGKVYHIVNSCYDGCKKD